MAYTTLLFLSDTFQFEVSSIVTGCDEDEEGPYIITESTVFFPGGGGQEPDKGEIIIENEITYPVYKAALINRQVRHYIQEKMTEDIPVLIRINREHRLQNARLHTGGHLLSSIVYEKLRWPLIPVKGFHYQQGAYIEFEPMDNDLPETSIDILNDVIAEDIEQSLPVTTLLVSTQDSAFEQAFKPRGFIPPEGSPLRLVKIDPYLAYPCGGTHLHHTGELRWLRVKHIKHKKRNIRISYEAG
jgi:alanyl-tRNA synthetase